MVSDEDKHSSRCCIKITLTKCKTHISHYEEKEAPI